MFVWLGAGAIGVILGLLGGGGSILTVPLLVYGFGIDPKAAIATSLLIVGITGAITAIPYARRGQLCTRIGVIFGLSAMLGAYGGGWAARFISGRALLLAFAAVMFGTAVAMLSAREAGDPLASGASPCRNARNLPLIRMLLDGLVVGGVTGLVGAGGGFLVVPALHLLGGLPMHAAVGTSVLVIAMKSFAGFAAYLQHVEIDYRLAAAITLAALSGTFLGLLIAKRLSARKLRRGFGLFVLAMAFYLFYREWPVEWSKAAFSEYRNVWMIVIGIGVAALGFISLRLMKKLRSTRLL